MTQQPLKLYVWHDSLTDWTSGVMFALASGPEEARAAIRAARGSVPKHELEREPTVYDSPIGFAVWGGG